LIISNTPKRNRSKTGTVTLQDKSDKAEHLPPYLIKQACYAQFCLTQWYIITSDNKGCLIAMLANNTANYDEELIPRGALPNWKLFHTFWSEHYPDLLVNKSAGDICLHCCKFYNR
jgi:hypothetical protein